MNKDIEYLRKLLVEKEKTVTTSEDKEKIENLKSILKNDEIFFELSMDIAVGIFDFLGVPQNDMIDLYFKLISPEAYQELPKEYVTVSKEK